MSEIILLEPPNVFWCHQNDQERHSRFCSTRLFAFQFKYLFGVPRDVLSCFLFLFTVEVVGRHCRCCCWRGWCRCFHRCCCSCWCRCLASRTFFVGIMSRKNLSFLWRHRFCATPTVSRWLPRLSWSLSSVALNYSRTVGLWSKRITLGRDKSVTTILMASNKLTT